MGQIADDMIEGRSCCLCGCYFIDEESDEILEHGYPVVCWECWDELNSEEKKMYQKAEVDTL